MTRSLNLAMILIFASSCALAGGTVVQPIAKVVMRADHVAVVEILETKKNVTVKDRTRTTIIDFKVKVKKQLMGTGLPEELRTSYKEFSMAMARVEVSGSGLETSVKMNDKCIFIMWKTGGEYRLKRAEKIDNLQAVEEAIKEREKKLQELRKKASE